MSATAESLEFAPESMEGYSTESYGSEAGRPMQRPRLLSVPGSVSMATLNTPRGAATLNLPTPAASLAQYRALESMVNDHTVRMTALQSTINKLSADLAARRRDQQSQTTTFLLFSLLSQRRLRDDLVGHTHDDATGSAVLPSGGSAGGDLGSILPLLLLTQPGFLGTGGSTSQDSGGLSPLLLLLLLR